jgi:hypothetical protein
MSRHSSTVWTVAHGGASTVEGYPLTDGRRRLIWVGFERIGLLQSWFFCSLLVGEPRVVADFPPATFSLEGPLG